MIGLALSGGGSRAIAFHLGCLRGLNDLGILGKIGVISTISGGSVVGASYAYSPNQSFEVFESRIWTLLRSGFHRKIVFEILKPNNFVPSLLNLAATRVSGVARALGNDSSSPRRYPTRTDFFRKVLSRELFSNLTMGSARRNDVRVVIGACELRTGTAFRFSNDTSGGWRFGRIVGDVDLSLAVAASAAYPLFLPAMDRTFTFEKNGSQEENRVLLSDGGVYDNLGLQVLEPGRDATYSLHTYPCDHLIVCNAGYGQQPGVDLPSGFYSRVKKSFGTIHRRVQDSSMHQLHQLRERGLIKGFAMPYLGQIDEAMPWKCASFVSRKQSFNYPTDFKAMDASWIDILETRGEQLTKILVSHYLPDLL